MRGALRDALPGTQVYFFIGGIVKRILNFGSPAPIDVEIVGYDLEAGGDVRQAGRWRGCAPLDDADGKPWLTDLQISREENYPELDVVVDREKAGMLGLSRAADRPDGADQPGRQHPVRARSRSPTRRPATSTSSTCASTIAYRSHVDDLSDAVRAHARRAAMVSLDTVARVKRGSGPVVINRKYLQRIVDVTANVAPGKDLGAASAAVQRVLDELPPPTASRSRLGGQTEAQKKAFADLGFAALLAIVLVYMVLASQFKSLLDPLVIMFSVPLGVTGVFLMLCLTGTTLSVNSFMGIIMMVGIVVSNGVLLVDFANVLRERGVPLVEATIEAGRTRLRPILMTTIATIVGLIPMALGIGEGSETNLPLARAVIGGLTVSTVFTLFLVPALYTALERLSKRSPGGAAGGGHARAPRRWCCCSRVGGRAARSRTDAPSRRRRLSSGSRSTGPSSARSIATRRSPSRSARSIAPTRWSRRRAPAGTRSLTVNGTYTRLDHDRRISSTGQIVASGNQLTANLQLTVPLVAARAWADTHHAESTRRIAEASAADVRRQVAQATARAYLTVVAEHRLIAAVETARASAKEHFDYAHTRLAGGIGRAIDEVRAAQDLATVERQVQSTYVGLAQAREALGILLAASGPRRLGRRGRPRSGPVAGAGARRGARPPHRRQAPRRARGVGAADERRRLGRTTPPTWRRSASPSSRSRPRCCSRGSAGRPSCC